MPRPVLVLQHASWERPAIVAEELAAAGLTLKTRVVLDDASPALPAPTDLAALVVMGGPMGALDDANHPGLAAERELIAAAVDAGVPVLGVCLGSQLVGVALGGTLHPGHGTEIGFAPVELLAEDPVLGALGSPGETPEVFHWHGDAVQPPAGATVLARTAATPAQAFRLGSALAIQFHVELDAPTYADWLAAPVMAADAATHGVTDLVAQGATRLEGVGARGRAVFARFAAAVAARA